MKSHRIRFGAKRGSRGTRSRPGTVLSKRYQLATYEELENRTLLTASALGSSNDYYETSSLSMRSLLASTLGSSVSTSPAASSSATSTTTTSTSHTAFNSQRADRDFQRHDVFERRASVCRRLEHQHAIGHSFGHRGRRPGCHAQCRPGPDDASGRGRGYER